MYSSVFGSVSSALSLNTLVIGKNLCLYSLSTTCTVKSIASPAAPSTPAIPASPAAPEWFEQNKWPLLGGLAAAGLLGGGAYAYHRSKQKENKKDSTEDDDEEKEAQYKPYTSYTPPIISPYKFFNYYGQSS